MTKAQALMWLEKNVEYGAGTERTDGDHWAESWLSVQKPDGARVEWWICAENSEEGQPTYQEVINMGLKDLVDEPFHARERTPNEKISSSDLIPEAREIFDKALDLATDLWRELARNEGFTEEEIEWWAGKR